MAICAARPLKPFRQNRVHDGAINRKRVNRQTSVCHVYIMCNHRVQHPHKIDVHAGRLRSFFVNEFNRAETWLIKKTCRTLAYARPLLQIIAECVLSRCKSEEARIESREK